MVKVSFRVIVLDSCTGCGICWAICPKGVLVGRLRDKAIVASQDQCMGCFSCQSNCPFNAITVQVNVNAQ
ncbi:MAG: 4Fe-4S dicluster domain-containing protein [Caldivirga sp.]